MSLATSLLLIGLLAVGIHPALPDGGVADATYLAVTAAAAVSLAFAAARASGTARRAWGTMAVGQLVVLAGEAAFVAGTRAGIDASPSAADGLFLTGFAVLLIGTDRIVRARRPSDHNAVLDASIIVLALSAVLWVTVVGPMVTDPAASPAERAFAAAYPVLDVALVALALRLWFDGPHSRAILSLIGAYSTMLVAAVGHQWSGSQSVAATSTGLLDVGWLLGYVLLATAPLWPDSRTVTVPSSRAATHLDVGRLAVLAAAVLSLPALLLWSPPASSTDVTVLVATTAVLFVLVLVRLWRLVRYVEWVTADRTEARFRSLVTNATDVIATVDTRGLITYVSPAVARIWAHAPADVIGTTIDGLVHPDDRPRFSGVLRDAVLAAGVPLDFAGRIRTAGGEWRDVEVVASSRLDDPAIEAVVLTMRDVTQRRELQDRLERAVHHDALTDLPNRALLVDLVDNARERCGLGSGVAVLFIDIDDFKGINERMGHAAGDLTLQTTARRLSELIRQGDTAARLGGDEFALLLTDVPSVDVAVAVADRVVQAISQSIDVDGQRIRVSGSVGVAFSAEEYSADGLLSDADTALHHAKEDGKARAVVFSPDMQRQQSTLHDLRVDLPLALEREEFFLEYQPIVDLATGETVAVEALIRWQHPEHGRIPPLDFIPFAEHNGLITPIGRWVLERACTDAVLWRRTIGRDVAMSVNVSARQITGRAFVEDVQLALSMSGLPPSALVLELTESVMMTDTEATLEVLSDLRRMGVRLAVDDFGTGYCSLAYLRRFPLDLLKVDRAFTTELGDEAAGHHAVGGTFVDTIHQLSATLGLSDVAEGVETADQAAVLVRLGVALGQGWHFARPMSIEALLALDVVAQR